MIEKNLIKARAYATVANQPTYDAGGFVVDVLEVVAGTPPRWETLTDEIAINPTFERNTPHSKTIRITNIVGESGVSPLSTFPDENTAGRVIVFALDRVKDLDLKLPSKLTLSVAKGISIKGTGLGSSGASPAAALVAFEKLIQAHNPQSEVTIFDDSARCAILAEADFDVPDNSIPAFFGSLVHIENNHGIITHRRIEKGSNFGKFVIVTPLGFGIKTNAARQAIEGLTPPENNDDLVANMIQALQNGDTETYGRLMEEAHEWFVAPRIKLYPDDGKVYNHVYNAAKKRGALGVTISGSGPTMLAVVHDSDQGRNVGSAMHNAFQQTGYDSVARLIDINNHGAEIV